MEQMTFIGETVPVEWTQEMGWKRPLCFVWQGERHVVKEVLARWEDHSFPRAAPKRKRWYHRRHRTYYEVETLTGDRFRLYLDRGAAQPLWTLLGRLVSPS